MQHRLHEACKKHSVLLAFSVIYASFLFFFFFLSLLTLGLGWTFPMFLTLISSNSKGISQ